jgi:hypothetical protein
VRALLLLAAAAAACAAGWIYWPALSSYLLTDDFQWLDGAMVFTPAGLFDVASRSHFYRPAVEAYFALMYRGFGCSPAALHAANLALHMVNAALVMVLAQALTADAAIAAIAGLLFATQPALAQAVLWPAAISSVLCATCGLAMLIADEQRVRVAAPARRTDPAGLVPRSGPGANDGPTSRWWSLAVVIAFALALSAHESGVVFLAAALLLRYGREGTADWRRWLRDYLPCALLLAGYLGLTAWINSRNYVITEGRYRGGLHVLGNLFDYLVALYQGRHRPVEYVMVAAVLALLLWRAPRRVRAWVLWLLAAIAPVLAFTTPPASRYLYIPSVAFSLLLATGIVTAGRRLAAVAPGRQPRVLAGAVMTALVLFLLVRSALFARKGTAGFDAEAAPFARAARDLRPLGDGTSFAISAAEVTWMDRQYLAPLTRVAACDPRASVVVE